MEYGTDEYWATINNLMNVVVKEGEAGHFTKEGLEEGGTEFLFRIVKALEPFGVRMQIRVVPDGSEEDEEQDTDWVNELDRFMKKFGMIFVDGEDDVIEEVSEE